MHHISGIPLAKSGAIKKFGKGKRVQVFLCLIKTYRMRLDGPLRQTAADDHMMMTENTHFANPLRLAFGMMLV